MSCKINPFEKISISLISELFHRLNSVKIIFSSIYIETVLNVKSPAQPCWQLFQFKLYHHGLWLDGLESWFTCLLNNLGSWPMASSLLRPRAFNSSSSYWFHFLKRFCKMKNQHCIWSYLITRRSLLCFEATKWGTLDFKYQIYLNYLIINIFWLIGVVKNSYEGIWETKKVCKNNHFTCNPTMFRSSAIIGSFTNLGRIDYYFQEEVKIVHTKRFCNCNINIFW